MITKCWKTKNTSHRRVCHWCFYHILTSSVICYWTDVQGNMESTHFLLWTEKKNWHTCLIPLDYSRICFSLSILKSQTLLFVLTSSFLLYYTVNSLLGKFFIAFTCSFKTVGLSYQWHTMATVIKICFSLGIFKLSRTLFVLVSPLFLFVTSYCEPFLEAFTCLHWNSFANILKPHTMLNKTKKNNFPWYHPFVCTLTNRSWDHGNDQSQGK